MADDVYCEGVYRERYRYEIIRNPTHQPDYFKGSIEAGGVRIDAKFVIIPTNNQTHTLDMHLDLKRLTHQAHDPYLLVPAKVYLKAKSITFVYFFDESFTECEKRKDIPPLFDSDGIMNKWWSEQFHHLIGVLESMRKHKLFHGELNRRTSYVMVNGHICVIRPTINATRTLNTTKYELGDNFGFSKFCNNLKRGHASTEFKDFLDQMKNGGRIEDFGEHPALKTLAARFDYLRALILRCNSAWERDNVSRVYLLDFLQRMLGNEYEKWDSHLKDDTEAKKLFMNPPKDVKYNTSSFRDLLRFIEHLMTHLPRILFTTAEIARVIEDIYPGLVTKLHNGCVAFRNYCDSQFNAIVVDRRSSGTEGFMIPWHVSRRSGITSYKTREQ